jgi:hypothetical protein
LNGSACDMRGALHSDHLMASRSKKIRWDPPPDFFLEFEA